MKATGIVRRVDDLGRIVIPKEIRRTLRIREGDPLHTILTSFDSFFEGHAGILESSSVINSVQLEFFRYGDIIKNKKEV